MAPKVLKIVLILCIILVIIFAIKFIQGTDPGSPLPNKKGSPLQQKP